MNELSHIAAATVGLGDRHALTHDRAAGFLEDMARTSFRDLTRVYGFEHARQIVAEIVNDEADRRRT